MSDYIEDEQLLDVVYAVRYWLDQFVAHGSSKVKYKHAGICYNLSQVCKNEGLDDELTDHFSYDFTEWASPSWENPDKTECAQSPVTITPSMYKGSGLAYRIDLAAHMSRKLDEYATLYEHKKLEWML